LTLTLDINLEHTLGDTYLGTIVLMFGEELAFLLEGLASKDRQTDVQKDTGRLVIVMHEVYFATIDSHTEQNNRDSKIHRIKTTKKNKRTIQHHTKNSSRC